MWFAALDALVAGVLVGLALLPRWRRDHGATAGLVVAAVGGLTGGLLGFALVSGSSSSGPLQVTSIVGGLLGALLTSLVLRGWVLGDRAAAAAALDRERASAAAHDRELRRSARRERRAAAGPPLIAELAVAALLVLRHRGRPRAS